MATMKKIEKNWTIIIERKDGTRNEYRFDTKTAAIKWAKSIGLSL